MKRWEKYAGLILIFSVFVAVCAAQSKSKKQKPKAKKAAAKPVEQVKKGKTENLKILAGNLMGNVEEPLIYAARDAAAYEHLKTVVPELPPVAEIDFKKNAVVAAFMGTKSTAGFEVAIVQTANGTIKIDALNRPEGAMVAQVLTTPFKVALISIEEDKPLSLDFGADWRNAMQTFRVTNGDFSYSGGIAGMKKQFGVEGIISVMRVGELITFELSLNAKAAENGRKTKEIVSGVVEGDSFTLGKINAGNLVEQPNPGLSAVGKLSGNNLTFTFKALPPKISDSFSGEGKLTATRLAQ